MGQAVGWLSSVEFSYVMFRFGLAVALSRVGV